MTDTELVERLRWLEANAPNFSPPVMSSWIDNVRPELAKAADRLEQIDKDAERYRFMRDNDTHTHGIIFYVPVRTSGKGKWIEGSEVDAAIDAAMEKDK